MHCGQGQGVFSLISIYVGRTCRRLQDQIVHKGPQLLITLRHGVQLIQIFPTFGEIIKPFFQDGIVILDDGLDRHLRGHPLFRYSGQEFAKGF